MAYNNQDPVRGQRTSPYDERGLNPYSNEPVFYQNSSQASSARMVNRDSSYTTSDQLDIPSLPWIRSSEPSISARSSMSGRSIDASSLHVVKRFNAPAGLKKKQRWTKYKWWLLLANSILFVYALAGLVLCFLTWFRLFLRADVIIIGESLILWLATVSSGLCLITSFLGYIGIMLNNRAVLALYNIMMWPCFGMIASIGYVSYRRLRWNLNGKLSFQWHYLLSASDRARIQANMHCCGYKQFDDFPERSNKCFPRTLLPGCSFKYQQFTSELLKICWIVAFGLLPFHIFVLIVALMCSNHVNRKFGKGLPPKIYRLEYQQGIVAATPSASMFNVSMQQKMT